MINGLKKNLFFSQILRVTGIFMDNLVFSLIVYQLYKTSENFWFYQNQLRNRYYKKAFT